MGHNQPLIHNQLLNLLEPEDLAALQPHLERVVFKTGDVMEQAKRPIDSVYFVEYGLVSVVALMNGVPDLEIGMIGPEGMSGLGVVHGDMHSVYNSFAQSDGAAQRMNAATLRETIASRSELRDLLIRYSRSFTLQVAATALANGRSKLEERLARWLLMVQDRVGHNRFRMTHDFLATMLGVRRPGVTVALHILEGKGLIRAQRAEITIVDREGLIAAAEGAYGFPEAEYRRLLGERPRHAYGAAPEA